MPKASDICCVPGCNKERSETTILHKFPHPTKDPDRFRTWIYAVGGDILAMNNDAIFKYRRICHSHFLNRYHTASKYLTKNAVPSLHLPGFQVLRKPLQDVANTTEQQHTRILKVEQGQHSESTSEAFVNKETQLQNKVSSLPKDIRTKMSKTSLSKAYSDEGVRLAEEIRKLKKANRNYAARLRSAEKLTESAQFKSAMKKFTALAVTFFLMQFREGKKHKMGRRFNKEEKILALSLYKQGPKAYRWLRKIFVLPAPVTLSRMISRAQIKTGVNEKLFKELKKRILKMKPDERLCSLLFDEVSLSPHFDYNKKSDYITGFVDNGIQRKNKIADHALVFMIRGILKNYKQPIAYSFCAGTTPKVELAAQIKLLIKKLQSIGLTVMTTVCDQGTTNVGAIKILRDETRANYLRQNKIHKTNCFEIDGNEVIPLFDPPHLIKGIRNNLLTKDLSCNINNIDLTAKWDHILNLYREDPTYQGLKLVPKLTDYHVDPKKIKKMKVKYATQLFSQTVAKNMGYLAEKGILPKACKDTADVILFFDELFDSLNGSYYAKSSKPLLRPVTPASSHHKVWTRAKSILKNMKFLNKIGARCSVPSLVNWISTIDNIEHLTKKLFTKYAIKSFWMRHFNQDPLENFFGCIRNHGARNVNPTCAGFEIAFSALLINNLSGNHSPGANCEKDQCYIFKSLGRIFFNVNIAETRPETELDWCDLSENILVDFELKKQNSKIISQIEYVSGYVLRLAKRKIYRNCSECFEILYNNEKNNEVVCAREYEKDEKRLTYPSTSFIKSFSEMQDIATHVLKNKSYIQNLKNYVTTLMCIMCNLNYIKCQEHGKHTQQFVINWVSEFFIQNWCKENNKILKGIKNDYDAHDVIKHQCYLYQQKRKK